MKTRDLEADCLRLIKFAGFTKQRPKPFAFGARHMGVKTEEKFEEIWERVKPVYREALGWRFEEDTDRIQLLSPAPKGGPQLEAEQRAVVEYLSKSKAT
jgi:hypothetical protein